MVGGVGCGRSGVGSGCVRAAWAASGAAAATVGRTDLAATASGAALESV